MAIAQMSIENAPRTLEGLSGMGAYQGRILAGELEQAGFVCWSSPEEKVALLSAQAHVKAEKFLRLLQEYDIKHGKKATALAMVETPTSMVVHDSHDDTATVTTPKRQPRTRKKAEPEVVVATTGVAEAMTDAMNGMFKPTVASTGSVDTGALSERLNKVLATVERIEGELTQVNGWFTDVLDVAKKTQALLTASMKLQEMHTGILSLMGEEILKSPKAVFLKDVMKEAEEALKLLE
jgi:hypothetical protein